ncbi:DUF2938 domain-containing protein [Martelella alba]|uniref:DUF2938 domain-containing protein n=1 Tax=Martelella alba TaxID=2590451 RepID=A0A506U8S8_9HYPH|nr:DUF2938 family protein [Martelella alba]TPW28267.1 DUF2938 domain-containing protein [Martelella alba]
MSDVILFSLVVGIGATIALDIWVMIVKWVTGILPTNWGVVARWLIGLTQGQFILNGADTTPPGAGQRALGWAFHYVIGISYAVLLLLFWGAGFIQNPTVWPVVIIGFLASTLAGMFILFPGLGAGVMAHKLPNQAVMLLYLVVAHAIFAAAQYGLACWVASGL